MTEPDSATLKAAVARGIANRYRSERLFHYSGLLALLIGLGFLAFFFYTVIGNGYTAFWQTRIELSIPLEASAIDPDGTRDPECPDVGSRGRLPQDGPGLGEEEENGEEAGRSIHGSQQLRV